MENLEAVRRFIYEGRLEEALAALDEIIRRDAACDVAFYLRGNIYRKKNDWQQALNNYLAAIELNPDSPAKQAYEMLIKILDFYNKDMYNH